MESNDGDRHALARPHARPRAARPPPPPTTTSCAAPSPTSAATGATQPEIEEIAEAAGVTPTELHHLFRRWAGLTPKAFLQALTLDSARELLRDFRQRARRLLRGRPVRPGPAARPVRHPRGDVAGRMEVRRRGPDHLLRLPPLAVRHGAGDGDRARPRRPRLRRPRARRRPRSPTCARRWPKANYVEDAARTAPLGARIFDPEAVAAGPAAARRADRHRFRGAGLGDAAAHPDGPRHHLFRHRRHDRHARRPRARSAPRSARTRSRFVVPCHRVLGKSGELTGYHWGLTRKRAMLGWEAGRVAG